MIKRRLLLELQKFETLVLVSNVNCTMRVYSGATNYFNLSCVAGTSYTILIPDGVTYTISNSAVTNYNTPGDVSYKSVGKSTRNVTRTYTIKQDTVNIKVTGTNAVVTVSYNGATQWSRTCNNGTTYTLYINYGTSYTISFAFVNGFDCPNNVSYTANGSVRNVTGNYGQLNGVYIETLAGNIIKTNNYTSDLGYNSIIISDGTHKYRFYPKLIGPDSLSNSHTNTVSGVQHGSSLEVALTLFSGKTDTTAWVNADAGLAKKVANFTFPNGQKAFMPSLGEANLILNIQFANLKNAMSKIGIEFRNFLSQVSWEYYNTICTTTTSDSTSYYDKYINYVARRNVSTERYEFCLGFDQSGSDFGRDIPYITIPLAEV